MRVNSMQNANFNGLWERKVKVYKGKNYSRLLVATYHPFKDEEITPEMKKQAQNVNGYSCSYDIGYNSAGECVHLNYLEKKAIGEPLNITKKEYKGLENLKYSIECAEDKLEYYCEQYKNLSNLYRNAEKESAKTAYLNALKALEEEMNETKTKIKQLKQETKTFEEFNYKYTNEYPIKSIYSDRNVDNIKMLSYEQIREYLRCVDYD